MAAPEGAPVTENASVLAWPLTRSGSVAPAANDTCTCSGEVWFVMASRTGALLTSRTVMVTFCETVSWPSVTDTVTVWLPS